LVDRANWGRFSTTVHAALRTVTVGPPEFDTPGPISAHFFF